jgi:hypothetical protein
MKKISFFDFIGIIETYFRGVKFLDKSVNAYFQRGQKDILFTNKGRTALKAMIEDLNLKNSEIIIPSFICSDVFVPLFTQQLGVFGKFLQSEIDLFFENIPAEIKFIDQKLNEQNLTCKSIHKIYKNYKLKLGDNYEIVSGSYNRNCRRNIRKAESSGFSVKAGMTLRIPTDVNEIVNKFNRLNS